MRAFFQIHTHLRCYTKISFQFLIRMETYEEMEKDLMSNAVKSKS